MVSDESPPRTLDEAEQGLLTSPHGDDLFRALAATQRRRILSVLLDSSPVTVAELTDLLTGWEAVEEGEGIGTRGDRRVVEVTLHHQHLPALEETGLVEYDSDDGEVALADPDPDVRDLLTLLFGTETDEND